MVAARNFIYFLKPRWSYFVVTSPQVQKRLLQIANSVHDEPPQHVVGHRPADTDKATTTLPRHRSPGGPSTATLIKQLSLCCLWATILRCGLCHQQQDGDSPLRDHQVRQLGCYKTAEAEAMVEVMDSINKDKVQHVCCQI